VWHRALTSVKNQSYLSRLNSPFMVTPKTTIRLNTMKHAMGELSVTQKVAVDHGNLTTEATARK